MNVSIRWLWVAMLTGSLMLAMHRAGSLLYPIGYVDDDPTMRGKRPLNLPIYGSSADVARVPHDAVVIGIGNNRHRQALFERLMQQGEQFVNACHPTAVISPHATLGIGCVVQARAVVNVGSSVGDNVILNTGCSVDHHNQIGSHVHIAPGAHTGGDVVVGDGVLVGIGATVMSGITVGIGGTVGAGAVVIRHVAPHTTVVGIPAQVVFPTPMDALLYSPYIPNNASFGE
ncbi:MAG: NeuD/PglB/VioB family sugar acetyltransferase [Anaerolineales bacterium]|nr:NeuD/PglB/VioB family sugar acetyltransferase [Anaerolineales bacterium]